MLRCDFLLLHFFFLNQHHTEPPVQIMSFGHVLFSLCWSRFGASAPCPCALQKVTAAVCDWSLSAVCDPGNAACDSYESQRMRATGGKALINCKKLAAVDPACKSFKFGPKSSLMTATRLKTVFSRNRSRLVTLIPGSQLRLCIYTFVYFFSKYQMFRSIACLFSLDDNQSNWFWLLHSTTIRPKWNLSTKGSIACIRCGLLQFLFCNLVLFPFHVSSSEPVLLPKVPSTAGNQKSSSRLSPLR